VADSLGAAELAGALIVLAETADALNREVRGETRGRVLLGPGRGELPRACDTGSGQVQPGGRGNSAP